MSGRKVGKMKRIHAGWCMLLTAAIVAHGQGAGLEFRVLDDIAKPTKDQADVQSSPTVFDGVKIVLKGAGNEVVAFQLLLQAKEKVTGINVRMAPFDSKIQPQCELFLEFYQKILRGGYGWGTGRGALPWQNKRYPDPLIPLVDPYAPAHGEIAQGFTLDPTNGPNQGVWVDVFIPKDFPAGSYKSVLSVEAAGTKREIPVSLQVYNFSLPDETHCDCYGELYGLDSDEKKFKDDPEGAWALYRRFIQMGHAHRFLPLLVSGSGPAPYARTVNTNGVQERLSAFQQKLILKDKLTWVDFDQWGKYYGEVLDGTLFTREQGYAGPCEKTPPSFFQAPFPELWSGGCGYMKENGGALDDPMRRFYANSASNFWNYVQSRKWDQTRFFCYIFDECDGGVDKGAETGKSRNAQVHRTMKDVQDAIDQGAGPGRINMMWTSHTRPGLWVGTSDDISDIIRWWVPNAAAYDVDFFRNLRARKSSETFWFYHDGQPAIGNHSVNETGIDLMTWGLMCWKYKVNGSFWWSMLNSWRPQHIFEDPCYSDGDDRWGNGTLVYPGKRLAVVGFKAIDGPVASFRMKSFRRGQQDYEYLWLLSQRKGSTIEADALLDKVIQAGLSKADGLKTPGWSQDPADWYKLRADAAVAITAAVH